MFVWRGGGLVTTATTLLSYHLTTLLSYYLTTLPPYYLTTFLPYHLTILPPDHLTTLLPQALPPVRLVAARCNHALVRHGSRTLYIATDEHAVPHTPFPMA